MEAKNTLAAKAIYRLLFRALLEMRSQGQEHGDKVVFRLADLLHNVVLEMQNATEGKCSYENVLNFLEERAKETGCEKWLEANLASLNGK
jgi:hypothetical protein